MSSDKRIMTHDLLHAARFTWQRNKVNLLWRPSWDVGRAYWKDSERGDLKGPRRFTGPHSQGLAEGPQVPGTWRTWRKCWCTSDWQVKGAQWNRGPDLRPEAQAGIRLSCKRFKVPQMVPALVVAPRRTSCWQQPIVVWFKSQSMHTHEATTRRAISKAIFPSCIVIWWLFSLWNIEGQEVEPQFFNWSVFGFAFSSSWTAVEQPLHKTVL